MTHPEQETLALYAGGDLTRWEKWRVDAHLRGCDACRREMDEFRRAALTLGELAGEMPAPVNWNRLSVEMRANIHVGLAAGECVGTSERNPFAWRPAFVMASFVVLMALGWYLQFGRRPTADEILARHGDSPPATFVQATSSGVEYQQNGRGLTLLHPVDQQVTMSVSLEGAVRARYVDAESGQVTINNVYVQ
jgi:hypothetical protein